MKTQKISQMLNAVVTMLMSLLLAFTANATTVKLDVTAPFDIKSGRFNLDEIEDYNLNPILARDLTIPYDVVQEMANTALKANIDQTISDKVTLADPSPDVNYSVKISSNFEFIKQGQPLVTPFGTSTQNGLNISLEDVQAKLTLNISVHADSWTQTVDVKLPIEVILGAHANASAYLWPTIEVPEKKVFLSLDGKNIELIGLNGEAIQLGAKLGAFLFSMPIANVLITGTTGLPVDPLTGAIIGAIVGNTGAKIAEEKVKAIVSHQIENALATVNNQLETELAKYVDPVVNQANNLKDQLLGYQLPGLGKTINDLQNDWGVGFDVRTWVANNRASTAVTTRFSAENNGGRIYGKVRLPKKECKFLDFKSEQFGSFKLPIGLKNHNADLANKVGQLSNTVFNPNDLLSKVYLGEDPESRLRSGDPANSLPRWNSNYLVNFPGVLRDSGQYYEFDYEVFGLPSVAISELVANQNLKARFSAVEPEKVRSMHLPLGNTTLLFNSGLQPFGPNGVIVGGKGPASAEDCPSEKSGAKGLEKNFDFKSKFDPDKCPTCGFMQGLNARKEPVYIITDHEQFLSTWNLPFANTAISKGLNTSRTATVSPKNTSISTRQLPKAIVQ